MGKLLSWIMSVIQTILQVYKGTDLWVESSQSKRKTGMSIPYNFVLYFFIAYVFNNIPTHKKDSVGPCVNWIKNQYILLF